MRNQGWTYVHYLSSMEMLLNEQREIDGSIEDVREKFGVCKRANIMRHKLIGTYRHADV
jgi:hypothetical protein